MTFFDQACIAAMQSLIVAHPRETPDRISSMSTSYARSLEHRVAKPKQAERKMIWFSGMRVEVDTMPIDCTDIGRYAKATLINCDIKTVGDLLKLSYLDLAKLPNMGKVRRADVYAFLDDHNLSLSGERL